MADVSVRPARPHDVGEIARIQVDTWRTGYAELLPETVRNTLSTDVAETAWGDAVGTPPTARHRVLVAFEKDQPVGFAASGPADDLQPDDPEPHTTVAVGPLLVEPRWGRRGHGSRLLAATMDHARSDGMTRAIVWIPEGDTASREFFGSAGWAPDGLARVLDTGDGQIREVRLHARIEA